jgi:hypothetical protein
VWHFDLGRSTRKSAVSAAWKKRAGETPALLTSKASSLPGKLVLDNSTRIHTAGIDL